MSATQLPTSSQAWIVTSTSGGVDALKQETIPVPNIDNYEVLVKLHAASLNYRDLCIPRGQYPFCMPTPSPARRQQP